jgi:hypothetical protein
MPSDKFWSSDEILLSTPDRNYTVNDYKQFFDDINYPLGYEYREVTKNLVYDLQPPHVETHCLYGVGLNTPSNSFFTYFSKYVMKLRIFFLLKLVLCIKKQKTFRTSNRL